MGAQASLGCHRRLDSPHRAAEDHEEGIALGADLDPATLFGGSANDRGVFFPDPGVSITELLQQPGGAFDVREEEGDRPGRQLCHSA